MPPSPSGFRTMLSVALIMAIVGSAIYFVAPSDKQEEAKKASQNLAMKSALTSGFVPWLNKAEPATKSLLRHNLEPYAEQILFILHPSGTKPELMFETKPQDDRLLVQLDLTWRGGAMETEYASIIMWEFDDKQHLSAKLLMDTSVQPDALAREQLNDYFRTIVYPDVRKYVANGAKQ